MAEVKWSIEEIKEIAKWHKYVIIAVPFMVISTILSIMMRIAVSEAQQGASADSSFLLVRPLILVFSLAVTVFSIYVVYKLAKALKRFAILYPILLFIPFIALLTLLILNSWATSALQLNGVRVGMMGARQSDLDRLAAEGYAPVSEQAF